MQLKFKTVQGKQFELAFEDGTKVRPPLGRLGPQIAVIGAPTAGAGCRRPRWAALHAGGC